MQCMETVCGVARYCPLGDTFCATLQRRHCRPNGAWTLRDAWRLLPEVTFFVPPRNDVTHVFEQCMETACRASRHRFMVAVYDPHRHDITHSNARGLSAESIDVAGKVTCLVPPCANTEVVPCVGVACAPASEMRSSETKSFSKLSFETSTLGTKTFKTQRLKTQSPETLEETVEGYP